ncbi:hypothetical protein [Acinetobacter sp. M5A5_2a]
MNTQTPFLNKRIKAIFTVGELIGFVIALLFVIALAVAAGFTAAQ